MKTNKTTSKATSYILLILFIISSFIVLIPYHQTDYRKPQYRAQSLTKKTIRDGNTERTDYLDENGAVTVAADAGYATMIATSDESGRLEHFYDEKGEPVSRYPGFYALLREYDDEGRNYRVTYLDIEDMPVMTGLGYSTRVMTFYDTGKVRTEKYYDPSGNPVCTRLYGYGLLNEYDENGRNTRTTHLDSKDKPMVTGLGYAIVKRNFYQNDSPENGKTESEFYYDENGKPIALSLGQYGVHKEYDEHGRESVLTYLDETGYPAATNKGYTTVYKTYYANNYTASERYFDTDGNPFSLSDGQYGIGIENDQITYLDKDGREVFNIRRILYNHTWIIIPCSVLIIFASTLTGKRPAAFLLVLCVAGIAYLTLLFRESGEIKHAALLWSYRRIFINHEARADIVKNIWLFIPLGAVLYKLYPRKTILLVPVLLSALIEGIQYFNGMGYCELADIINNSLGGWIGFRMAGLAEDIRRRIGSGKQIHSA